MLGIKTARRLQITAMDDLYGLQIASRFSQEAARLLSKHELAQLFEFLKAPKAGWRNTEEQLHQVLMERLENFYLTRITMRSNLIHRGESCYIFMEENCLSR